MNITTFTDTAISWTPTTIAVVTLITVWSLVWKGLALWHAGRHSDIKWFIPLLVINTMGILEILYLLGVREIKLSKLFSK